VHSVLPPHHAAGDNMARMMEDAGRAWAAPLLEEVDEEADFGRWLAHFSGDAETSAELLARVTAVLETLMARGEEARAAADAAALAAGGAPGAAAAARVTLFHGLRPPPIGLAAYLERIAKYSRCSPVCFVVGLAYLQRLAAADPAALAPSPLNVHRLALQVRQAHHEADGRAARVLGDALQVGGQPDGRRPQAVEQRDARRGGGARRTARSQRRGVRRRARLLAARHQRLQHRRHARQQLGARLGVAAEVRQPAPKVGLFIHLLQQRGRPGAPRVLHHPCHVVARRVVRRENAVHAHPPSFLVSWFLAPGGASPRERGWVLCSALTCCSHVKRPGDRRPVHPGKGDAQPTAPLRTRFGRAV